MLCIAGDWKATALKAEVCVETVTEGGQRFMAAWRKDEVDADRRPTEACVAPVDASCYYYQHFSPNGQRGGCGGGMLPDLFIFFPVSRPRAGLATESSFSG